MSYHFLSKSTKRRRVLNEIESILPSIDTEEESAHESSNESVSSLEMNTVFIEQSHSG